MNRVSTSTAALALMALAAPAMTAAADDAATAPSSAAAAENVAPGQPGIVGISALRPDGTVAGVVQEVVRDEQNKPVHVVIARDGEGGAATEKGEAGGGPMSFSAADRDRYEIGWDQSLGDWADRVDERIDELGDEAAEELQEAWDEVEGAWAALKKETGETWHRTQASFEAAFDAFEREWASNMAS